MKELQNFLDELNDTATTIEQQKCIHELFEAQADAVPDRIAVTCASGSITYSQLNTRSSQLASYLRQRGVAANIFVGICIERSIEMVVGILGILKAGGVYVPLDPEYPSERLQYMIEDCKTPVLLTLKKMKVDIPGENINIVYLDQDWEKIDQESDRLEGRFSDQKNYIYVIYTSGSTGKPKGTLVYHRGFVNLLHWYTSEFEFGPGTTTLLMSSTSFDLTQKNIFAPLISGGHLVLLESQVFDAGIIEDTIQKHGVTSINCTPSMFLGLVQDGDEECFRKVSSLQQVFLGGEPIIVRRFEKWRKNDYCKAQVINSYGPTECTDVCVYHRLVDYDTYDKTSVPIGRAICNTSLFIIDEQLNLLPIGEEGELCIGGLGVGAGYLNRPDITRERFVRHPFTPGKTGKIYRTGDLVRYLDNGNIEYLGRIDQQVKIRGFRIELGEIEAQLDSQPSVRESVVVAKERASGDKYLAAYIVPDSNQQTRVSELRQALQKTLPDYMLPTAWKFLEKFPLTPNGKIDRLRLPDIEQKRPDLNVGYVPPENDLEKILADLWREILGFESIGIHDPFFELGGTSIQAIQFIAKMGRILGRSIPIVNFFDAPTLSGFTEFLIKKYPDLIAEKLPSISKSLGEKLSSVSAKQVSSDNQIMNKQFLVNDDIAIIGMAGRFPGSANIEEFWNNLTEGREMSTLVSEKDLMAAGLDLTILKDPSYVNVSYALEDFDKFDAAFFGYTPKEAEMIDPQQRLFLECAWSALEDGGYDLSRCNAIVGIFGGVARNGYLVNNIASHDDLREESGEYQFLFGNEKDYVATRVAYKLNLRGPAVNVQTACSTSGVAIHLACKSLQAGDCDMALVGGTRIEVPHKVGYSYSEGGTFSRDGHIKAFDAESTGMVRGNGGGCVLLKRLQRAVADGDHIYAVIKSSAVNNDGADKIGFPAPSARGQAEVITKALSMSGLDPETIQYIECHGTGTRLGDPIELAALSQAYDQFTSKKGFCYIGSVKTNIGHLDAGSCIAGVIKTVMGMNRGLIPPSLHYQHPNPDIDFDHSPFKVNAVLQKWPDTGAPRRAGVSSFGMGGSNAHIILEYELTEKEQTQQKPWNIFILSGRSETALEHMILNLKNHVKKNCLENLSDVAYTLQTGRREFQHRAFIVCRDAGHLVEGLDAYSKKYQIGCIDQKSLPKLVFMFPGQGAQHVNMGRELYETEPEFRKHLEYCSHYLKDDLGVDLIKTLYPAPDKVDASTKSLNETHITQVALFSVEYALAKLWISWGITPDIMVGHSIGEYVAACISGVYSIEDALSAVLVRGRLMYSMERGAMLAVQMSADELEDRLEPGTCLSVINAPNRCVVSGPIEKIKSLENNLLKQGAGVVNLHTSHGFHSEMMEPAMEPFVQYLKGLPLNRKQIPFISCCSGTYITDEEAIDPHYWTKQLRQPVLFSQGVRQILDEKNVLLLEVGPGNTLSTLARMHATKEQALEIITSWDHPKTKYDSFERVLTALGKLWLANVIVNWKAVCQNQNRKRTSLPTYPFERKRYWIEPTKKTNTILDSLDTMETIQSQLEANIDGSNNAKSSLGPSRIKIIKNELRAIIYNLSGLELTENDDTTTFLDLGLDSIFMTQIVGDIQKKFGVKIKFRLLFEEYTDIEKLAVKLNADMPEDKMKPVQPEIQQIQTTTNNLSVTHVFSEEVAGVSGAITNQIQLPKPIQMSIDTANSLERVISQQLAIMQQQLDVLQGGSRQPNDVPVVSGSAIDHVQVKTTRNEKTTAPPQKSEQKETKAFGAGVRIEKSISTHLTDDQKTYFDHIVTRYIEKTKGSKTYTEKHRKHLADPRAVSGFSPVLKEMVYPIVINRSSGANIWDIDDNEYIDMTNGFGANLLGYSPDYITDAINEQLRKGIEIGPQHPLAGEVAEMVCEFSGQDRTIFCNTGSEAVMGAMRIARTVTGRDTIVMFTNDYHGMFDEVIVRGTKTLRSVPASAGIPSSSVEKTLILEYGDEESIRIIRERAHDIAAVLVEPVQSRNLDLQPSEFLKSLREETNNHEIVLIFDEVVTGFRCHQKGAQAYFNIQADIVTYGKIVGGGLPIGVISGKSELMDSLDGGLWQYGDSSVPEVGVTYFAGTFVRHPLVLAAAKATLTHLKKEGPGLQETLNRKTAERVADLKNYIQEVHAPIHVLHFSSAFQFKYTEDVLVPGLIYVLLRQKGVHIAEGRTWFFTTAHSDRDMDAVICAFKESIYELQAGGLLSGNPKPVSNPQKKGGVLSLTPPVPGAKLGKCPDGNPAWFIPNPDKPGKYLQVK